MLIYNKNNIYVIVELLFKCIEGGMIMIEEGIIFIIIISIINYAYCCYCYC